RLGTTQPRPISSPMRYLFLTLALALEPDLGRVNGAGGVGQQDQFEVDVLGGGRQGEQQGEGQKEVAHGRRDGAGLGGAQPVHAKVGWKPTLRIGGDIGGIWLGLAIDAALHLWTLPRPIGTLVRFSLDKLRARRLARSQGRRPPRHRWAAPTARRLGWGSAPLGLDGHAHL
ncbi:MAG: hypothetical protein AAFX51_16105, partial [Cyanobacteria bacterium J06636_28]